jgi:hypothetical protein
MARDAVSCREMSPESPAAVEPRETNPPRPAVDGGPAGCVGDAVLSADHHVEQRHEEEAEHGGRRSCRRARRCRWRVRLADPAPVLKASGSTPNMKASEVIRIGRRRSRTASSVASISVPTLLAQRLGELDDQDGVLRREADGGQQADLEVDVVVQPASQVASTAPITPSGTTSITENGTDQLSYSAARQRKTKRIEMA